MVERITDTHFGNCRTFAAPSILSPLAFSHLGEQYAPYVRGGERESTERGGLGEMEPESGVWSHEGRGGEEGRETM